MFKSDSIEVSLFADLCSSLLTLNPKERPAAKDVCGHKYFGDLCTMGEERLARLAVSLPLTEAGIEVSDEDFGSDVDQTFPDEIDQEYPERAKSSIYGETNLGKKQRPKNSNNPIHFKIYKHISIII